MWSGADTIGASGGGGSHATAGSSGADCQDASSTGAHGGEAGGTYGDASLDKVRTRPRAPCAEHKPRL